MACAELFGFEQGQEWVIGHFYLKAIIVISIAYPGDKDMIRTRHDGKTSHPLAQMFNRYYWLQIGLIALSIVVGLACSAWVIKGSLLKTALEQEMEHYWLRIERNPNADLPDTKNLYGYRWNTQVAPQPFRGMHLESGVHRVFVDGKERMTVYGERNGQHVLLVFGESNVNKLIWLFGLAPLMFSLSVLYSFCGGQTEEQDAIFPQLRV